MLLVAPKVGKRGCVETFLSAVSLVIPLWATSHAVDYVCLGCDLLIFMKCASPAMKQLYANEIFTRLTPTGGLVYSDERMEKVVRDIRNSCGKLAVDGLETRIESCLVNATNQQSHTQMQRELRTGSGNWKTYSRKAIDVRFAK